MCVFVYNFGYNKAQVKPLAIRSHCCALLPVKFLVSEVGLQASLIKVKKKERDYRGMASAEEVAALTEQLEALKAQLDEIEEGGARRPVIRVSIPKEKKLRRFAGGVDDKALEGWIADADNW